MIRARLACLLVTATRPTAARRIQCVQPIAHGIQRRGLGRLPQGEQANNPLEDPQQDMGGPGGQELYPVSMALHKYVHNTIYPNMVRAAQKNDH